MTQGGTKVPAPCAPSRTQQLGYILQYDNDEPRCYSAIATLQCIGNSHSFWSSSATAPLPAPLQGRRPPCVPGPRTRWHTRGAQESRAGRTAHTHAQRTEGTRPWRRVPAAHGAQAAATRTAAAVGLPPFQAPRPPGPQHPQGIAPRLLRPGEHARLTGGHRAAR